MHISQVIILLGEEWTTSFYKREPHMSWFSASLFKDRFALRYEENMTAGWGAHLSLQAGGFMGFLDPLIWLPDGPAFGNHQLGTLQSPGVFLLRQFSTSFKKKKKGVVLLHFRTLFMCMPWEPEKNDPGNFFLGVQPEEVIGNMRCTGCLLKLKKNCIKIPIA